MKPYQRTRRLLLTTCSQGHKMVLLALADHLAEEDSAWVWPSVARLVRLSSSSERTVQRALRALVDADILDVDAKPGRATRYRIRWADLPTPVTVTPPSPWHPRQDDTPVTVTPAPVTVTPEVDKEGDQGVDQPLVVPQVEQAPAPDDWTQLRDHLATYRPTASGFRRDKGNGRELARMLKAVGSLEKAKQLITLAYTSKASPHPFNRERGKGHPPLDTLRRNGVRYLEDAQDEVAHVEGPNLSWDEVCAWWADGKPRGPVTRWFRDRGENPDNWTSRMHPRKREKHRAAFLALGGQL